MPDDFLLYGANGYSGALIARQAVARGLRPTLAGRNDGAVGALAAELGLPHRVAAVTDRMALDRALVGMSFVLHCAGPFAHTSAPMADACLRAGAHYLDITGELAVFEGLAARSAEAAARGVMLLPGVGFDVVPSDCLAAHLKRRLPGAVHLALAFQGLGGISRGTAATMVEHAGAGGAVRRNGRIVRVPAAWKTRRLDLGAGEVQVTTIPWGDVSTAFHSTGIPNVEVYTAMSERARRSLVASRYVGWLLATSFMQQRLKEKIRARPAGPSERSRARVASHLWGAVTDALGRQAVSRLHGPQGYTFTALTAVAAAERVLGGRTPPGFQTPSLAFGADFVLGIDGVSREDVV